MTSAKSALENRFQIDVQIVSVRSAGCEKT
jgi:hypothetical protein